MGYRRKNITNLNRFFLFIYYNLLSSNSRLSKTMWRKPHYLKKRKYLSVIIDDTGGSA